MQYLDSKEYPTEAETDYKLDSIDDLVFATFSPTVRDLIRKTARKGMEVL